jgi:hypothetical protein
MPYHFAGGSQPNLLANFFFIDPNGSLSANPDLHSLFNSFSTSNYSFMGGGGQPFTSQCFTCGSLQFSISNATVSAVPLPPSAVLTLSGLSWIGWFWRWNRAAHHA